MYKNIEGNKDCGEDQLLEWLDSDEPGQYDIPVGSIEHGLLFCPAFEQERQQFGSQCMSSSIKGEFSMEDGFRRAHSSGLFPAWEHPSFRPVTPPAAGSFDWVMKPVGESAKATFYTDGSRMDAKRGCMARLGWAFVALDDEERIVATARGVPPQ